MITRNTIHKKLADFAANHLQIKDFWYGDAFDISMDEAVNYQLMWVCPQPAQIKDREIYHIYEIAIADRIVNGRGNAVEVESDTFQTCLDILAWADDQAQNDWELDPDATITPMRAVWKDNVDGNMFILTLKVPFDYNSCQIPTIN